MSEKCSFKELKNRIEIYGDFYQYFDFGYGLETIKDEKFRGWNLKRIDFITTSIRSVLSKDLSSLSVLDLACNAGLWSFELSKLGATKVLGIDAREKNITMARTIRNYLGFSNVEFDVGNIADINHNNIGIWDVTLLFGLMYNLEDPIHVLKQAYSVTNRVAIIDTIVMHDDKPVLLVDYVDNTVNRGALGKVALRPTKSALIRMIRAAGFTSVVQALKTPELTDDYLKDSRIVLFAFK